MSNSTQQGPKISLMTAMAIVVANMVGTGVFTSLGFQLGTLPAGFPIVILWMVGGVLAFCGAVSYAELAAMMPRSGGEYHLLGESYHPVVGFVSGWISVVAGFSVPIAVAAIAFGEYFSEAMNWGKTIPLALVIVSVVTLIHLFGIRVASQFQVVFTVGKILLIIFLTLAAFIFGESSGISFSPLEEVEVEGRGKVRSGSLLFTHDFAQALFWVMYAYAGWNAAAYVVGEMKDPGRNVPLALMLGTGIVAVLYVGLNAAFLWSTPIEPMVNQPEVGYVAANHIFGESGGKLVGLLICFGLISTISSMVWAGPRVTQVIGEDFRIFRFLSIRPSGGSPVVAILVQTLIVFALLFTAGFETLLYYVQAIITLSSLMVVLAVYYLRWKRPDAERRYRAWGYPFTPAIFALMSIYMLYVFVLRKPQETAWGLLTLVAGVGVYYLALKFNRPQTGEDKISSA